MRSLRARAARIPHSDLTSCEAANARIGSGKSDKTNQTAAEIQNPKEDSMSSNSSRKTMKGSLHFWICLICLLSLFAIRANAQHVHQLLYNNYNWTDQSLAGSPVLDIEPYPIGNAAFTTTPNNQVHVYYVDSINHVHQRTRSQIRFFGVPRWVDEDLTQETGAEPAYAVTMLSGFSEGNYQYVFYGDDDGDIHMLFYDNSKWTHQDISAAAGSTGLYIFDLAVTAFTTTPNNQIHVYYLANNFQDQASAVHQLFFNGTSWSDEDLTAETGAFFPEGGWWAGFSIGNYQYLFYPDIYGYLHELYYNNSNWTDVDLSVQIGAPTLGGYTPITAFVVPGTQTMEVFYTTGGGDIYQISSSDNISWNQQDLTTLTHGPSSNTNDAIMAFATTPNNQLHVYYISSAPQSQDHVNQLFFNGSSWSNEDLTSATHAGNAFDFKGMSGFSLGNFQYVYYVGK
jgi:hypothetical protein